MADRPIIFSAPMIRGLLAGAKTQTRRILKPQPDVSKISPPFHPEPRGGRSWVFMARDDFPGYSYAAADFKVQFVVGDRLWARETWKPHSTFEGQPPRDIPPSKIFYRADEQYAHSNTRWRPGIHMPRWASRLTLTATDVRVQQLQDISEEDAQAEGVETPGLLNGKPWHVYRDYGMTKYDPFEWFGNPRDSFRSLWESINGPGSWEANPWVAASSFRVERRNIDAPFPASER